MSGTRKAKLGIMQVPVIWGLTVEQYHEELLYLAERCLEEGADLVFMPEAYQYVGADVNLHRKVLAERYAEVYKEKCAALAKKYKAYVAPWDYEIDSEGKTYNTTYILDRQGVEVGRYRKVNLPLGELETISPGMRYPVFDLDFGKVGIMICFDNFFQESAEILALNGAELILYPLFGDTFNPQWEIKVRARAIDNTVYVAPCLICSSPPEDKFAFSGLVGPEGEVICRLTEDKTYKVIEIEPGKKIMTGTRAIANEREDIKQYLLKTRNTEAFKPISDKRPTLEWDEIFVRK